MSDGMSRPATSVCDRSKVGANVGETSAELRLRRFTGLRDELVSTLWYVLGNQEDAQDVAQEAFLRCWRTQEGLPEVQNLKAWIFRVGLNAAKDLHRSAWRRRVKPLLGADAMPTLTTVSPMTASQAQEAPPQHRNA